MRDDSNGFEVDHVDRHGSDGASASSLGTTAHPAGRVEQSARMEMHAYEVAIHRMAERMAVAAVRAEMRRFDVERSLRAGVGSRPHPAHNAGTGTAHTPSPNGSRLSPR